MAKPESATIRFHEDVDRCLILRSGTPKMERPSGITKAREVVWRISELRDASAFNRKGVSCPI
jgi:hypothetical protein